MTQGIPEKDRSITQAIEFMKKNRPLRTEEICRDYLLQNPGCTDHLRLLSNALMKQNRLPEAEERLRFALSLDAEFPQLHEDLGSVLALQSKFSEAIPEFERAIELQPALPLAHKKLGQALVAAGRGKDADEAFQVYIDSDEDRATIMKGVELLRTKQLDDAVAVFQSVLKRNPDSVNAMRYLAVCYWQGKTKLDDAEALLRRATQLAKDYLGAWLILGALLLERNKNVEAIAAYQQATKLNPKNPESWAGLGSAFSVAMYPDKSVEAYDKSIELNPKVAGVQMGYAHALKTVGRQADALIAYRAAIAAKPDFGEVYWSMANLKIFKFEPQELEDMQQQLQREDLSESADIHFRFALGKAFEDEKEYDKAWHHYHTGNQRQRMTVAHEPIEMENRHAAVKAVFNRDFIAERANQGFDAADAILIVGLPRSGSTLVEQILASHSQVEGTAELPVLGKLSQSIGRYRTDGVAYPEAVSQLRKKDWRAYGQQYIEESRRYRVTDKPIFTDKLPNNFPFVGLMHLILPNTKVINARRHPFDSCLGGYKQLFGQGQNFTYDMLDLAHYYKQYDAMMKYWHDVLPGKVLDVHYEVTVTDLESQVRRILDHCGLPFEESCVRFHETERAVKTASSEQVRQPIYTGALGTWRRYEKHLGLWQDQLGYIIDELPEVSKNAGL
ncbi:MAG TPA: sulfotransferase [Gammaproteobacteria bacterium]|nr:sulfotransferase [Gammaproteobacteria bacterium]